MTIPFAFLAQIQLFFGAGDNKEPSNEVKTKKFALITAKLYICPGAKSLSPHFGLVSRIWISEPGLNCNNALGCSLTSLLTTVVFCDIPH